MVLGKPFLDMPVGSVALVFVNVLGGKMSFLVLHTQSPGYYPIFISFLIVHLTLWHGRLGDTRILRHGWSSISSLNAKANKGIAPSLLYPVHISISNFGPSWTHQKNYSLDSGRCIRDLHVPYK